MVTISTAAAAAAGSRCFGESEPWDPNSPKEKNNLTIAVLFVVVVVVVVVVAVCAVVFFWVIQCENFCACYYYCDESKQKLKLAILLELVRMNSSWFDCHWRIGWVGSGCDNYYSPIDCYHFDFDYSERVVPETFRQP
jgi:hypothetical protein